MSTVIVLRGLPGSGRTAYADRIRALDPEAVRVSAADIALMLNPGGDRYALPDDTTLDARDHVIAGILDSGRDVIVDDVNAVASHTNRVLRLAVVHDADVVTVDMDVTFEQVLKRNKRRPDPVDETVLRALHKRLGPTKRGEGAVTPMTPQPYRPAPGLPKAWIFDIDGTLAIMDPNRGPYDWDKVSGDSPNPAVVALAKALLSAGETVLVFSGRNEVCRRDTQAWLDTTVAPGLPLFMRPENDGREDSEVKLDLFNAHVRDRFEINGSVDDRLSVTRMWRHILGLTTFQVAWGRY